MILAEKIVTALERGATSTRWRDFGDVYSISRHWPVTSGELRGSLVAVADHRGETLIPLEEVLGGYADAGQALWSQWRRSAGRAETLPDSLRTVLDGVQAFADPVLRGRLSDSAVWNPRKQSWALD